MPCTAFFIPASPWLLGDRNPWNRDATSSGKGKLGSARLAGPLVMDYPPLQDRMSVLHQPSSKSHLNLMRKNGEDHKAPTGPQTMVSCGRHKQFAELRVCVSIYIYMNEHIYIHIYINTSTHTPFKRKK